VRPLVAFAFLLALSGCDPAPPNCTASAQTPDVAIGVVDDMGMARCDAVVVISSAAQGQEYVPTGRPTDCSLYTVRIPVATYDLAVSAPGYAVQRSKLTVAYADEVCGTLALTSETITLTK
jgi:hypothetical protein